jgi:hypothetical protein
VKVSRLEKNETPARARSREPSRGLEGKKRANLWILDYDRKTIRAGPPDTFVSPYFSFFAFSLLLAFAGSAVVFATSDLWTTT